MPGREGSIPMAAPPHLSLLSTGCGGEGRSLWESRSPGAIGSVERSDRDGGASAAGLLGSRGQQGLGGAPWGRGGGCPGPGAGELERRGAPSAEEEGGHLRSVPGWWQQRAPFPGALSTGQTLCRARCRHPGSGSSLYPVWQKLASPHFITRETGGQQPSAVMPASEAWRSDPVFPV